ncbi:unnamed protein product [Lepidochelys olivacea]
MTISLFDYWGGLGCPSLAGISNSYEGVRNLRNRHESGPQRTKVPTDPRDDDGHRSGRLRLGLVDPGPTTASSDCQGQEIRSTGTDGSRSAGRGAKAVEDCVADSATAA